METPSKAFAEATQISAPLDRLPQTSGDWRLARAAYGELLLAGMPRVNLLLVGGDGVVRNVLEMLRPDLRKPIVHWYPGAALDLPPVARAGTVMLQEIGRLSDQEQLQLLEWLERAVGRVQVVSTTSTSLLPLVQKGAFLDALYYRLNIVCVDVDRIG